MTRHCARCHHSNSIEVRFCANCQADLSVHQQSGFSASGPPLHGTQARRPPPPERRPVETTDSSDPLIGQQLGNYSIEKKIGQGGFGAVYKVRHLFLEQPFAIKLLRIKQQMNQEVVLRFQREARALAQLQHDNIVDISDFGLLPEFGFYMVMEYLDGVTLHQQLVSGEHFDTDRLRIIIRQMCEVLQHIHEQGVIHRDLKPENIFLLHPDLPHEKVKLIDFGIAALKDKMGEITQAGTYLGTFLFASPEQAQGKTEIDGRADLYSLGILLYIMLTRKLPFHGSEIDVLQQQVHKPPPPLSQAIAHTPWAPELEQFIQRALAKEPDQRPRDGDAFWREFERALIHQEDLDERTVQQQTELAPSQWSSPLSSSQDALIALPQPIGIDVLSLASLNFSGSESLMRSAELTQPHVQLSESARSAMFQASPGMPDFVPGEEDEMTIRVSNEMASDIQARIEASKAALRSPPPFSGLGGGAAFDSPTPTDIPAFSHHPAPSSFEESKPHTPVATEPNFSRPPFDKLSFPPPHSSNAPRYPYGASPLFPEPERSIFSSLKKQLEPGAEWRVLWLILIAGAVFFGVFGLSLWIF